MSHGILSLTHFIFNPEINIKQNGKQLLLLIISVNFQTKYIRHVFLYKYLYEDDECSEENDERHGDQNVHILPKNLDKIHHFYLIW
jgi:hypothetical protein